MKLKLYFPIKLYNVNYRRQVFPLLKPFLKTKDSTDSKSPLIEGVADPDFILVNSKDNADVFILPMSWNYYSTKKQMTLAYALIAEANEKGKQVWSINNGDFGIKLPQFENLVVFRQSGYVSKKQKGHFGFPSIIYDYLSKNNLENTFFNSSYSKKPIVGFCGLTNDSKKNAFLEVTKQSLRNLRSQLKFNDSEPQTIYSTTYLRAKLLKGMEGDSQIDSRFIKRKQYRAGVTKNKETHHSTLEFYNNILESQYVLCVRGAGNFSVRFYETLMMGRIPLYIHTDGFLPLSDSIDWKSHVVWVDYKDRNRISEILLDFHERLDQDALMALFKKNRKLWQEKLTLTGFFKAQKYATLNQEDRVN